jgi:PAS domain S-box-containing protein
MPRHEERPFRDAGLLLGLACACVLAVVGLEILARDRHSNAVVIVIGLIALASMAAAALSLHHAGKLGRASAKDASDRREAAEAALQQFREALDELPSGLEIYDADDRLLFANKRIDELYPWIGFSRKQGRRFSDLLRDSVYDGRVPGAIGREEEWLRDRLAARGSRDGPILQSLKGGVWINTYERRTRSNFVVGVRLEVTDLVHRTRELQASQERLQAIIRSAAVGIVGIKASAIVIEANPAAGMLFAIPVDKMLGQPLSEWVPGIEACLRAGVAEGPGAVPTAWRGELDGRDASGRALRLLVSVSAIGQGNERSLVVVIGDLTERERAEQERRVLEQQLREAQKMESIGTLASGIAHDFNNVLASIVGNADLARGDIEAGDVERAQRALALIRSAAERARKLVRQILTFSRHDPPQPVVQALQPVIDDALNLLRSTLPAQVTIERRMADAALSVRIDATQLEQVVLNLCTNAWHAIGDRPGRVEIGADLVMLQEADGIRLGLPPGRHVRLSVSDDGCGMTEATRRRIFDPFFTTKPPGIGSGLGLAMVHGIVQSHGGAVTVDSVPDQGTRFDIYLPQANPEPEPEPAAANEVRVEVAPAPGGGRGERVLYVDDDPVMPIVVHRLLERAGYVVACFADPETALAALQRPQSHFDVVVTDLNMPRMSGLDLARSLTRSHPGLAVVLTSGLVTDELRAEARRQGVTEVLEKENSLTELPPAVRRALDLRQSTRRPTVAGEPWQ